MPPAASKRSASDGAFAGRTRAQYRDSDSGRNRWRVPFSSVAWTVRFYRDLQERVEPARIWLDGLKGDDEPKRLAAIAAIERVLKPQGVDVCESEWGKNLGSGLYEFRIRHPAQTIKNMFPLPRDAAGEGDVRKEPIKILLRVFFTTYGREVILLLAGFDKGKSPSPRQQQGQIAAARAMADKAQAGLRARLREERAARRAKER